MLKQGLDLRLVVELLGFRTMQMLMRCFHLAKENLKKKQLVKLSFKDSPEQSVIF